MSEEKKLPEESKPAYWAVIPAAVRYDDRLRPNAKLLYGEISALASTGGFCYATNRYFAELYGFSIKTVGSLIGSLAKTDYITIEIIRGRKGEVEMRKIWLTGRAFMLCPPPPQKKDTPPSNNGDPPPQKAEENSTRKNINTPIAPKAVLDLLTEYAGNDAELRDALYGYAEMRSSIRSALSTNRMVTILLKNLDKLSDGNRRVKISMLDEATVKRWKTVYAPKGDFGASGSSVGESEVGKWE